MESNYGITEVVPRLNNEEQEKLKTFLKNFGVEDFKDLSFLTEEDLLKCEVLKPLEARKLIKRWSKPNDVSAPGKYASSFLN